MRIAKGSLTNSGNTYGSVVGAKLGYFRTQRDTGYSTNNDFILSGDYTFGDFRVDGLFGSSIFYREAETLMAYTAGGLSQPDFFSLNNAIDGAKATSSLKKQQVNSLYGRLALSWRDMIYVEATLRNDWSSTQASTPYKSYIYPSDIGQFHRFGAAAPRPTGSRSGSSAVRGPSPRNPLRFTPPTPATKWPPTPGTA